MRYFRPSFFHSSLSPVISIQCFKLKDNQHLSTEDKQYKSVILINNSGVKRHLEFFFLDFVHYFFRLKKKEFSLEEIYTNKNYKSPPPARFVLLPNENTTEINVHYLGREREQIEEF